MIARAWAAMTTGPTYLPDDADLRTIDFVGLRLPVRADRKSVV